MQVPLIIDTIVSDGVQQLKIWQNSECIYLKSSLKPFCYTEKTPPLEAKVEKVKKELLYDIGNVRELFKCSFRTTYDMKECCNNEDFYEYNFKFKDRISTCCPDLIEKYKNTDELKILYFDIETDSFASFPTASENAIIAIGYQCGNEDINLLLADTYDNDYWILTKFKHVIEKYSPDIIVTFNGTFFDIPYIIDRCNINNINPSFLSRDGSEPFVTKNYIKLGGRIHYDLYTRSVDKDQNLFNFPELKDRKMKSVCKAYKLDNVIEEDETNLSNMRAMVGTEELQLYLTSDIRCTKFLCDIYLPGIIKLAETIGCSLESCINSSPSYIGHLLHAKYYESVGIVSDGTVGEKYPELVKNKQGGLSCTYKPGIYKNNLRKIDIQSDYPNLIRTLNLSPETCRFVRFENELKPFTANMDHENRYLTLSIPDERAKLQLIIGIDFSKRGFTSSFVDDAMNSRLEMKAKMKTLDKNSPEYADLDVNQLQLKIIMNSITGLFGQQFAIYGSLACYCAITGSARHLIRNLIDYLGGVISLDTDGVINDSTIPVDEINKWLENFMYKTFEIPKNYMKVEEDKLHAGYFRPDEEKIKYNKEHNIKEDLSVTPAYREPMGLAKNYLLVEKDKNGNDVLVQHGASFKGTNVPKLFSIIIEDIGLKMLTYDMNDKSQLEYLKRDIAAYYDRSNWTFQMIKKSNKCKPLEEYKTNSPIGAQLIKQYEKRFNAKIKVPTQLNYVKVKRKFNVSEYQLITIFDKIEDIDGIDYDYYEEIVNEAFKRLDLLRLTPNELKKGKQKSLFDF